MASGPTPGKFRRAAHSPAPTSGGRYFLPTPVVDRSVRERRRACFLCAALDHESRECPNECCWRCGRPGHQSRDCTAGPGRSTMVLCTSCRRFGHLASACPNETVYTSEQLADVRCASCGEHGHLDCTLLQTRALRLFCYNCGQRGHFGEDCHRPGMDPNVQRRIVNASMSTGMAGRSGGGSGRGGFGGFGRGDGRAHGRRLSVDHEVGRKRPYDELAAADALFFERSTPSRARSPPGGGGAQRAAPGSAPARMIAHGKKAAQEERRAARVERNEPRGAGKRASPGGALEGKGKHARVGKVRVKDAESHGGGSGAPKGKPTSDKMAKRSVAGPKKAIVKKGTGKLGKKRVD